MYIYVYIIRSFILFIYILTKSMYRINELHPIDYCYEALNVKVETLDKKGKEYYYLFQYLANTYQNGTVVSTDKAVSEIVCFYYYYYLFLLFFWFYIYYILLLSNILNTGNKYSEHLRVQ